MQPGPNIDWREFKLIKIQPLSASHTYMISVGRTNKSKLGLSPFSNEYHDGILNLTDEKPLKDMKRHENTRTLHDEMRKDRIHVDTICFIYLGIIITAAI